MSCTARHPPPSSERARLAAGWRETGASRATSPPVSAQCSVLQPRSSAIRAQTIDSCVAARWRWFAGWSPGLPLLACCGISPDRRVVLEHSRGRALVVCGKVSAKPHENAVHGGRLSCRVYDTRRNDDLETGGVNRPQPKPTRPFRARRSGPADRRDLQPLQQTTTVQGCGHHRACVADAACLRGHQQAIREHADSQARVDRLPKRRSQVHNLLLPDGHRQLGEQRIHPHGRRSQQHSNPVSARNKSAMRSRASAKSDIKPSLSNSAPARAHRRPRSGL